MKLSEIEILATLHKNFKCGDIDFYADSGEGDDEDWLSIVISQLGKVYIYADRVGLITLGNKPVTINRAISSVDFLDRVLCYFLGKN